MSLAMEFSMLNESSTHPKSGSKLDYGNPTKHSTPFITFKRNKTVETRDEEEQLSGTRVMLSIYGSVSSFHKRNLNFAVVNTHHRIVCV